MRQWEIWRVPWRHENGEQKSRPGLIVSQSEQISADSVVWVMKISGSPPPKGGRVLLDPQDPYFPKFGLPKLCYLWLGYRQEFLPTELISKYGYMPAGFVEWVLKKMREGHPSPE